MTDFSARKYQSSHVSAEYCLRQAEILSNVPTYKVDLSEEGADSKPKKITPIIHSYAIVITQACDLEQDFIQRKKALEDPKIIPNVLFCEIMSAQDFLQMIGGRRKEWDRLKIDLNKNDRYHFLEKVSPTDDAIGIGLDEMVIDFKRYFCIPTDEIYHRIHTSEVKRRTMLLSPYLEHFCIRFAQYLSRIGLPEDHLSD